MINPEYAPVETNVLLSVVVSLLGLALLLEPVVSSYLRRRKH